MQQSVSVQALWLSGASYRQLVITTGPGRRHFKWIGRKGGAGGYLLDRNGSVLFFVRVDTSIHMSEHISMYMSIPPALSPEILFFLIDVVSHTHVCAHECPHVYTHVYCDETLHCGPHTIPPASHLDRYPNHSGVSKGGLAQLVDRSDATVRTPV